MSHSFPGCPLYGFGVHQTEGCLSVERWLSSDLEVLRTSALRVRSSRNTGCGDWSVGAGRLFAETLSHVLEAAAALTERLCQGEEERAERQFMNTPFEGQLERGVSQEGREAAI